MTEYEFDKYVCSKETLENTLMLYGVAIIPNVLDEDECKIMVNSIWDFFEYITQDWATPIKREFPETWREFYKLFPSHSMLIQHWGVGHAQASWDVRQNIKIVEIFAYIWKCDINDLLVSFDGLSFHFPPEITKRGWNRNHTWYHTDQTFMKPNFECIQSWVTGFDINEGDATLSFMEGSNKYHGEFQAKFNVTDKKNWYKLSREEEEFYKNKGCSYKNIKCPKGSLILWDSRTIHCGVESVKTRSTPVFRAVIYLCYMPKRLCSEKNLKKKRKAFTDLRTTSHYPCEIKMFPKYPQTYGAPLPSVKVIEPPILSELGKSLAGF
jgi:hypothetical protein